MKIATGIPNTISGTPGHLFVPWAVRAERCGFSSLGSIGRISYDCHEELMTFAACAGATERIRMMTTVLLGPVRETALLGKQAATLDSLSGGRFSLGLGLGAREEDYDVTETRFSKRGRRLDEQVKLLKRIWAGEKVRGASGPVGPAPVTPGGPPLILSGRADVAIERAGRMADGFVATPVGAEQSQQQFEKVKQVWGDREGAPYLGASCYFALGPEIQEEAEHNVRDYYAFGGREFIDMILGGLVRTPEEARERREALRRTDAQELFFWPVTNRLDQLNRLAEALDL